MKRGVICRLEVARLRVGCLRVCEHGLTRIAGRYGHLRCGSGRLVHSDVFFWFGGRLSAGIDHLHNSSAAGPTLPIHVVDDPFADVEDA